MGKRSVGFREVFSVAEFRRLWGATVISELGDQLARVAVVVLVYQRTSSAWLTALSYALTYLPAIMGGSLLAVLADRYPRRNVMVSADLARAILVILVAIPGMPLVALYVLLFAVQALESPARAARAAILPQMLDGDRYTVGVAAYHVTNQVTYVAGFLVGGLVVAATGPGAAFVIDAGTFALSATLLAGLAAYPPSEPARAEKARLRDRVETITGHPRLRWLAMLALLAAFSMTPLALAVPYGRQIGLDEDLASLLMAAIPAGYVAGTFVLTTRVRPERRARLLGPLALASFVPLLGAAALPPLAVMLALLVACGALTAYQVVANAEFVALVPDERRGGAVGVIAAALTAAQGLAMVVAGIVAEFTGAGGAIAIFGTAGAVAALALLRGPRVAAGHVLTG
ncbi:MFS transporter [Nonomuraea sp. NPDC003804]|uniref:MFS transporter n=1 Tax=Nonomuraea sp. NPDC003804 TaxID=3154547 RepID=UPI0033A77F8C